MKKVTHYFTFSNEKSIENVMIVDDDEICHIIISKNIELSGFAKKTTTFKNGINAIEELRNCCSGYGNFPDLIFLDINMPYMDGWEFLEEYDKLPQKLLKDTKIVVLSSSIFMKDIDRAKANKHVYEYIEKPISTEKLEELLLNINEGQNVLVERK